ncbi:tricarballylate utilization protein B [Raoultella terrigena]|uniref:Tricarballylate utilization protein B n=1 Tax=Raoultella terrigena TaxID=577 RepID=A0A4U9DBL7_RAOTE|nr:tricarballylate utilization protein B [Raoultella terrigena]
MLCFAHPGGDGISLLRRLGSTLPFFSVPVILGTLGGIGLVVGPLGLLWLNLKRSALHGDSRQKPMDRGFILLLLLTSLTGLGLLAEERHRGWDSARHPSRRGHGTFFDYPLRKICHGFYRCASLLKWAIEKRRGKQTGVAGD